MKKIILGATYTDKISNFEGVAVGHVRYLTGCNQTLLQPRGKKGSKTDAEWFDDSRLVKVDKHDVVTLNTQYDPGSCDMAPII